MTSGQVVRSLAGTRALVSTRTPGPPAIISLPVAPTISNVNASVTTTTANISWSLDMPATGQVNYGTTAAYGSSTTAETSLDYSSHVQTITGLTPGTLYHYRVRSTGSGAVEAVSTDYTFTTTSAATYPSTTAISLVTINADTIPGYLSEITDSTWGTKIRRVTNVAGRASTYPKCSAWSKNGTYVYIHGGQRVLNATTYADNGTIGTSGKGAYAVWSNVTDTRMYGADDGQGTGTGKLWTCDVTGPTWAALADFTLNTISGQSRAYGYVEIGNYEGNVSNDDHLIALACNTTATKSGQWDVVAYDPISNVVRGTLTNLGGQPSECGVSQSGSYVYVNGVSDGSGSFQGCRIYTSAMVSVRQVVTYRPHLDMGYDTSGNEVLVNAQAGNMHRLSNGTTTDYIPGANTAVDGGHVSCRNLDLPGWAYLTDAQSANSAKRGFGQIVAVKLDGSGDVRIFGFHHEVADLADNGNFGVPNRDGTKVLFTSRWGASTVYAFVAGVST